jgi:hypothetical protein
MRDGSTSVARMLPETSIARMTVSWCAGSVITALGRAIAVSIAASAANRIAGGRWRRHHRPLPIASFTSSRLA